jgi:hypothetical protein
MVVDTRRLNAAAHIARWRGWTKRPYSILEHMVVGAEVMRRLGYSRDAQAWFLLHDMHETEVIGDVPTPDKAAYCNEDFHRACDAFDAGVRDAFRLKLDADTLADVAFIDAQCAIMEHALLVTRACDDVPRPNGSDVQREIRACIRPSAPGTWTLIEKWRIHAKQLGLGDGF